MRNATGITGVELAGAQSHPTQTDPAARLLRRVLYVFSENPISVVALLGFLLLLATAVFGRWFAPYDPLATNAALALSPPSSAHWFGTDQLGRDVFSRVLVAARLDLFIALSAVTLSFAAGATIGGVAGFYGGWIDRASGRLIDTIMAFPLFVLAMGIVAALGNTIENIIYATAIINVPFYARVARAEVNVRRNAGFVQAARLSGNGDARILVTQVFPNSLPPMMVQVSLNMGWAILNAAGLSFIGLGVRPPTPEWGIMVA
ncbi:MAG: ABC transporter permease, partial [Pseudomonadota bacterium]